MGNTVNKVDLVELSLKVFPYTTYTPSTIVERNREKWIKAVEHLGPNWRGIPR